MCEVINDELHLDHMEIRDAQEGKEHATQMMPRRLSAQSVEQYGCRKLKASILLEPASTCDSACIRIVTMT